MRKHAVQVIMISSFFSLSLLSFPTKASELRIETTMNQLKQHEEANTVLPEQEETVAKGILILEDGTHVEAVYKQFNYLINY